MVDVLLDVINMTARSPNGGAPKKGSSGIWVGEFGRAGGLNQESAHAIRTHGVCQ